MWQAQASHYSTYISVPLMINLVLSDTAMLRTVSHAHGHSQFQTHFCFPGECVGNDYKTRGQLALLA